MRQVKHNHEPNIIKRAFKEAGLEIALGILGIIFLCFNLIFSFYITDKSLPSIVNYSIIFHPVYFYIRWFFRRKLYNEESLINLYVRALLHEFSKDDFKEKCIFYASFASVIIASIFQFIIMIT